MLECLRPGGLLVLAYPSPLSLKGVITKFTPHAFHVFVYRHFLGIQDAGQNDKAPFRTYLRWGLTPSRLQTFVQKQGLSAVLEMRYEDDIQRRIRSRYAAIEWVFGFLEIALRGVTFGKRGVLESEYVTVFRKPGR